MMAKWEEHLLLIANISVTPQIQMIASCKEPNLHRQQDSFGHVEPQENLLIQNIAFRYPDQEKAFPAKFGPSYILPISQYY